MKPPVIESGALLGDVAYHTVREAIRNGQLKAGDRISEYRVAAWLNVSRTPAREALRRLEGEGMLSAHPRRGLVVASIDDAAIAELYATREVLEATAARFAAMRATDAEIATLQHLVEAEAAIVDDPHRMYEHNRVFHNQVYRAAHNRYLLKFLSAIADTLTSQKSTTTLVQEQRRRAVVAEHRALVKAIAARDPEAAFAASMRHIQSALKARTEVEHRQLLDHVEKLSSPTG